MPNTLLIVQQSQIKSCYNVNKKKTENYKSKICSFCGKTFSRRFDSDRYIKNSHGTASNNESLMEDQEQKEVIPGEEVLEEVPTMVPIFITEQDGAASIDFRIEDLADTRVNEMPAHKED